MNGLVNMETLAPASPPGARLPTLLSVVVPVFNEEGVVQHFHTSMSRILDEIGCPAEIVFVDDGSSDGTVRDVEALRTLRSAGAGAALGLDHHRLGSAMAEALLHGAGRHRSHNARLQAQRSARPRLGRRAARVALALVGLVVFVAHPVALLGAEKPAVVEKTKKGP